MGKLKHFYYVGVDQPHQTVNQVLDILAEEIFGGDTLELPKTTFNDGGNVNIMLIGGGMHQPFKIPDNLTTVLADNGRFLVIRRQEFISAGVLDTTSLPVFMPETSGAADVPIADKAICMNLGNNNPNVKIRGLRAQNSVMGVHVGFNSHNTYIERCFITNCSNAQVYAHDLDGLYVNNNVLVGGEYGLVAKFCGKIRAYHNTVFVDGSTALSKKAKAGVVLQGERLFGVTDPSKTYFLGNLVYTVGAPAAIFYKIDADAGRIVSDYNDFFNPEGTLVQLRQDTTQVEGEPEIIWKEYKTLAAWNAAAPLGNQENIGVDTHSVSMHPLFIQNLSKLGAAGTSILDLSLISNSPLLEKVPSWFFTTDANYIPTDFDETSIINRDALLNHREKPYTAIGANDAPSVNGYFGQDIFTSPLLLDPEKNCDLDPLQIISVQNVDMLYPAINSGYFWSHERPYYLYGRKGASQIGFLAKTVFDIPAFVATAKDVSVKIQNEEVDAADWDVVGRQLVVYHRNYGVKSYEDEVQLECQILNWDNHGFYSQNAYYVLKIKDGETSFVLPDDFEPGAPVVITDDRVSLLDPVDVVRREFHVKFNKERQENTIEFFQPRNLIENSMFTVTSTYQRPAYWDTAHHFTGEVFMLGPTFSYYGDTCAGIQMGANMGWLGSNHINIEEGKPLTFSWHSRVPTDMGVTGGTGHWKVRWYDHEDNVSVHDDLSGDFYMTETGYNRYYLTVGESDTVVDEHIDHPDSTSLVQVAQFTSFPSGVSKAQLIISGQEESTLTGDAFFLLDAAQAEYDSQPSYFHPEPSLDLMTVEYETDPTGIFIDKRMNITSVFNENPNGFLYIHDMPATLWGGPQAEDVTTLNEYRWPIGRIFHLPWARLHGKDKLKQKVWASEVPNEPLDIISPWVRTKYPTETFMVPETLYAVQNTGDMAGFNIRVTDEEDNSYALRKYTLSIYEPNDNFPGWLTKRHLGAKEQLGMTTFGRLNSNGAVSQCYVPPENEMVRYVGPQPKPSKALPALSGLVDNVSSLKVAYNVNLENNGNITVRGENGHKHATHGTKEVAGDYFGNADKDKVRISLEYPPVFGSVKIKHNNVEMLETQGDPQEGEFFINYPFAQVELAAGLELGFPFKISYLPKYAYPDPFDTNNIIFHHEHVFGNYSGPIEVDYDAEVFLEIRVEQPLTGEFVGTFPIVIQNPKLGELTDNSLSLEF